MGYYTKKIKKIQSYRDNMPIFSNLTLTRLRAERQPDVDGAVCLYCQLHYLVIAPVKLWNNLI